MKKWVLILVKSIPLVIAVILAVCVGVAYSDSFKENGCTEENRGENLTYGEKEIAKIQSSIEFGEVAIYYDPVRTFDFSAGTVTDTVTIQEEQILYQIEIYKDDPARFPEYSSADEYESFLRTYYNSTEQVSAFSKERGEDFINKATDLGFFGWEEYYGNDGVTCGSTLIIKIFYNDGTHKKTRMYMSKPDNFEEIQNAFKELLGAEIFCNK